MAEFGPPCPDVHPTRTRRGRCSGALLGRLIPLPNGTLSPLAPKPGLVISPGPASQGDRRNGDCLLREGCNRYVPPLHRPRQRANRRRALDVRWVWRPALFARSRPLCRACRSTGARSVMRWPFRMPVRPCLRSFRRGKPPVGRIRCSRIIKVLGVEFVQLAGNWYLRWSPYPASAGCATAAGSRRTRLAPPSRVPVLS